MAKIIIGIHGLANKCGGLLCAFALAAAAAPVALPGQHIDPDSVTASGISSGGYMAVQMHVAYSALVKGAGVIAAGPYGCAQTGGQPGRKSAAGAGSLHAGVLFPLAADAVLLGLGLLCRREWRGCRGQRGDDPAAF